jgi:diguanylate cyclase (GGDEF)-like protein/PAS domain S-box-containing protein
MDFNPFSIYVMLCGALTIAVAYYAWRRRTAIGARAFSMFMLSMSIYILGYSMELASRDLAAALFWNTVEYIGILTFPTLYLIFTVQYTGREKWLSRGLVILLCVIPAVLGLIKVFDGTFHLIYSSTRMETGGAIPLLAFARGPLYLLISAYTILLLIIANYLLMMTWRFASPVYRGQMGIILAAALVIFGSYLFYLTGIPVVPALPTLDINPFINTLWGFAVGWAIFRHRLFDLAPIARDALIEELSDGVVVLDGQARVVDANPQAHRIFGWRELPAGRRAWDAMEGWIDSQAFELVEKPFKREIQISDPAPGRCFEVSISPLWRKGRLCIGYLIVAHDIFERKEIERQLRESSLTDELTGLHNRRGFRLLADQLIQMALRMRWNVLLFYIDLDGLKWINDLRGHAAGDRALIEAGALLKSSFRSSDVVARLGGDEFVVLAVESDEQSGPSMLARLEERRRNRNAQPGRDYRLFISIGTARLEWGSPSPLDGLMEAADQAMYEMKHAKPDEERHRSVLGDGGGI